MTLDAILKQYEGDVSYFQATGTIRDELFTALYEHWLSEMPYGTAKARTGDPYEWIGERLLQELE